MANTRLTFDKTSPFGGLLSIDVSALVKATSDLNRIMAVANSITGGGVTTSALEGSPEFNIGAGKGATFYADLQNIIAGLAAITILATLDQGN